MNEFLDKRDGNKYRVIKIGNLYWFAENLKYRGTLHYAPDNDTDNLEKYGCLYHWEDAMKACPEGWRLPSRKEVRSLLEKSGTCENGTADNLIANEWNNGNDTVGFHALPAGGREDSGGFYGFNLETYFWSSTIFGNEGAYILGLWGMYDKAFLDAGPRFDAFSVRCVKEVV